MNNEINRIAIIGGPGCGKTTLANKLSEIYGIPATHLDAFHHLENWQIRDENERDRLILEVMSKEQWIIDGTYPTTLKQRLEMADMVIWLDYSTLAQLKGIFQRLIKNGGKEKEDIPGCKERFNKEFLEYTLKYRKNKRSKIADIIGEFDSSKIMRFTNRRKLLKWLKTL